jgi:uncharacterized membrane protein
VQLPDLSAAPLRLLENVAKGPGLKVSSGFGISGFSVSINSMRACRPDGATSILAIADRASGVATPVTEPG